MENEGRCFIHPTDVDLLIPKERSADLMVEIRVTPRRRQEETDWGSENDHSDGRV